MAKKKTPGITELTNGKKQARYRDAAGKLHSRTFARKIDAVQWRTEQLAAVHAGTHIAPKDTRITVSQWADTWLEGYAMRRPGSVQQARVHLHHIRAEFGAMSLGAVRPSQVRAWIAKLQNQGYAQSTVYAIYRRLSHIMADAVHDDLLNKSPCSRRVSPRAGKQRPYVATTEQVWALHDAMPEHLRAAVLLAALAGLRDAEVCGLRVSDVDFLRGVISPTVQHPAEELKTEISQTPIPVPRSLTEALSAHLAAREVPGPHMLWNTWGRQCGPWIIQRKWAAAREELAARDAEARADGRHQDVVGLPEGFRFHDLRHYYASLLIESGANVKVVQARLRHESAKTTLDTYGHLWPDSDGATRTAVDSILRRDAGRGVQNLCTSANIN